MMDFSLYFTIGWAIVLAILRARAGYFELKLAKYLRKNCPEKERDFGCARGSCFNEFKLVRALYTHHDIEDPDFIKRQNKARNAYTCGFVVLGAGLCVLLVFFMILLASKA